MKSKFNASGLTALLCCMIALILLAAGVYKLLDPLIAVNALGKTVPGLRPEVRLNVVYSIASVEVLHGMAICLRPTRLLAARGVVVLGAVLAVASLYDGAIGNTAGCGCFGSAKLLNSYAIRVASVAILIYCGSKLVSRAKTQHQAGGKYQ